MEKKLRSALDKIYAEDALKEKTMRAIRHKARKKPVIARLAAACAMICLLLMGGIFSRLYTNPYAYVDLDVNPSIELTVNRYGRVIGLSSYNAEGAELVADAHVRNASLSDAISRMLDAMFINGYFGRDGLVSVTVQTQDANAEVNLLGAIESSVAAALLSHHANVPMDIYVVSQQTKSEAHEKNMSPAKYLAITELKAVDPTATYEGCSGHSITEIRRRTSDHTSGHHSGEGANRHHGNHGGRHE